MAIKSVVNPVDDSTITIAEGIVEKITYKDKVDNFGNTHSAGMLVDGNWINIALKTKEGYQPQVRFAKGQPGKQTWETLNEGDTVKIVVKPNEWNNKTYYSTTSSKINVTKKGDGQPAQQQRAPQGAQNASSSFKKDFSGIQTGHAINAAMNLIQGEDNISLDYIAKVAKQLHDVSERVKEAYKDANPNMSEYDVGAAAGQSVLTACKLVDNVEDVEEMALMLLDQVVPEVIAYVKGEAKEGTTKQQPKPAQKAKPQPKPVEQEPDFDDFLDDVPF